jgi:5-methylthioadenosine/S-adenosylhomocysteine deaminase
MTGSRRADLLILHIDWVITVDKQRRVIRDAGIAIADGRFAAIGKSAEIEAEWNADATRDGSRRLATPGFVDSHLHASFQLARGLADEVGTRPFLFGHMFPFEGVLTADDVHLSSLLAAMSLLRCGVTCFIDPGNYHPQATARAALAAGMRVVLGRSAFDMTKAVLGILPESMIETTGEALDRNRALVEFVAAEREPRLTASVSFRGLSNASDALITGCREIADEAGCLLQTHACFNYSTRDDCLANFGMPEIERLDSLGVLDDRVLLAHAGWLEPHEVDIVLRRRPNLVSAPSSSLHNGYGNLSQGRLAELLAMGVNVGIGSDHACSGITDIVQEMRLFAGTHKEVQMNPRVVPPEQVVEMATVNGARCAGLADSIGSIEVGKAADLVLFDTDRPEWQPLYNPVSNLVYSATGSSVADVFVAGRQVVADGALKLVDDGDIIDRVRASTATIGRRLDLGALVNQRWPVM